MILCIVIMGSLILFFRLTRVGIAMQAAAQDPEAARLMGINVERATTLTFAVSGMMAGAAGVLLGSLFFASFNMGFTTGIKAFVAATLGGLGSVPGAMVGGTAVRADRDLLRQPDLHRLQGRGRHDDPDIDPAVRPHGPVRQSRTAGLMMISTAWIARIVVLLALCVGPLLQQNSYWLHIFSLALIGTILAMGLQLLVGMAGVLSLGQGAFYGIGAYMAAALAVSYKLPFLLAILIGGLRGRR